MLLGMLASDWLTNYVIVIWSLQVENKVSQVLALQLTHLALSATVGLQGVNPVSYIWLGVEHFFTQQ